MKHVLILGASRYYVRSIETAKRLGYFVHVADKNPQAPGFKYANKFINIDITDYKAIYNYVLDNQISAIIPINDFGVYTTGYVNEKLNLTGININTAEIAINKAKLRKTWERFNLPNPKFKITRTIEHCYSACLEIGLPVILKPAVSMGGGRGISYIDDIEKFSEIYKFSTSFYADRTLLVEEFITGIEHSAEVLIHNGIAHVLAIGDNIKTDLPLRINKSILYPTAVNGEVLANMHTILKKAALSIGIENGVAHIEGCTTSDGEFFLYELGARPGGGGIPDPLVGFHTGINEMEQYIKICCGDEPDLLIPKYNKACNYFFIILKPGKIKSIINFQEIKNWPETLDAELFVSPGSVINKVQIGGDRSGFVIVGTENREKAEYFGEIITKELIINYE